MHAPNRLQAQHRCHIVFQVANVKRPLLAVSTLTRAGNHVSFGPRGGEIRNTRTGRNISFVRRDGIYVLEILVAPPPTAARGKPTLSAARDQGPRGASGPPPGQPGWQARLARRAETEAHQPSGQPDWKVVQSGYKGCRASGVARPGAAQ